MLTPKSKPNKYISPEQYEALPLKKCLAKTRITENQQSVGGRNIFDHCSIVGEVARELITRMPSFLR